LKGAGLEPLGQQLSHKGIRSVEDIRAQSLHTDVDALASMGFTPSDMEKLKDAMRILGDHTAVDVAQHDRRVRTE
jgi:hypothetical protein